MKKVMLSRNRISNDMIKWIVEANAGSSLAEWQSCVDDAAVAEVVIRDARLRGCILRKRFTGEELAAAEAAKLPGKDGGHTDKIPFNNSTEVK
jgi:hypothetical protein